MPYIKQPRRTTDGAFETHDSLMKWFSELENDGGMCTGDLNYILSVVIHAYTAHKGVCYQTISEVTAAMYGAQHEYERNIADPYEEEKKKQNGSVSRLDADE